MPEPPPVIQKTPSRPVRWGVILGVWTLYGLLNSTQQYLTYLMSRGVAEPWWQALLLQMPLAYTWALATPGILWLGRRFPFERGRWVLSSFVHLVTCVVFVFLLDLVFAFHAANVFPPVVVRRSVPEQALQLFVWWIFADGLLYWLVLVVGHARERDRRFRERQLAASQLETQLAQADLHALKAQLHPHFLFNALHTIGSLVRTGDRDNAVRVVAGLGDLLRRMLDGATRHEVPLRQELDFVRNYLEIERVRFRDRLNVTVTVDPDVLDATVPHLVLQPLVENAIRHGIAPHLFASMVHVGAHRVNGRLHLLVRDDGPGVGDTDTARPGIGLSNTRARLTRLYGDDFDLFVTNVPEGGLEAHIELPLRQAAEGEDRP